MPRDNSMVLSDYPNARYVQLSCERCGRSGRYAVARLREKHGDMRLIDFRESAAADCPNNQAAGIFERCQVVCEVE
jgi:hypothetical protein